MASCNRSDRARNSDERGGALLRLSHCTRESLPSKRAILPPFDGTMNLQPNMIPNPGRIWHSETPVAALVTTTLRRHITRLVRRWPKMAPTRMSSHYLDKGSQMADGPHGLPHDGKYTDLGEMLRDDQGLTFTSGLSCAFVSSILYGHF